MKKDIKYSKIKQLFKDQDPEEFKACKKMILVHYKKIVNIFNYYASHSSYPRMDIEKIKEFIASADFSGTRKME